MLQRLEKHGQDANLYPKGQVLLEEPHTIPSPGSVCPVGFCPRGKDRFSRMGRTEGMWTLTQVYNRIVLLLGGRMERWALKMCLTPVPSWFARSNTPPVGEVGKAGQGGQQAGAPADQVTTPVLHFNINQKLHLLIKAPGPPWRAPHLVRFPSDHILGWRLQGPTWTLCSVLAHYPAASHRLPHFLTQTQPWTLRSPALPSPRRPRCCSSLLTECLEHREH